MKRVKQYFGKLNIISRLPSSSNANPRFLCQLDDNGVLFRTAVDCSLAFDVINAEGSFVCVDVGMHYKNLTLDRMIVQ